VNFHIPFIQLIFRFFCISLFELEYVYTMYICAAGVLGCHTYNALDAVGVVRFAGHTYSRVSVYAAETWRLL